MYFSIGLHLWLSMTLVSQAYCLDGMDDINGWWVKAFLFASILFMIVAMRDLRHIIEDKENE